MNKGTVYDVVVIGTGTAGSTVASNCSSKGLKVAIIDSLPFGGTCALRGCEPKKILIEAAKTIDAIHRLENKSISDIDKVYLNWRELINFKRTFTEPFPKQREDSYIKAGIVPIHGKAKFIDKDVLKVKFNEAIDEKDDGIIKGKYILIATGARPVNLGIPGLENVLTSDQFLDLESPRLPDNIAFIGGGYISFEFAHIAARCGVKKITIFHRGRQPLERFDPDLVNLLVQKSKSIGIEILLETKVEKIERIASSSPSAHREGNLVVHYASGVNSQAEYKSIKTGRVDMVVRGAGRVPNIQELDLKAADIEYTSSGITVNEYLQSVSNSIIYAAGDVASGGGAPLTPVASYDGNIVSTNILNGNSIRSNYTGLPSVVFTIPPLATVGLKEKDAIEQGLQFRVNHVDTSGWSSSRRLGETHSGFKIMIEKGSDRILGAHLLGPHAEEVINVFSMAIRLGLTVKDLNDPLLYAYPTHTSDVIYML